MVSKAGRSGLTSIVAVGLNGEIGERNRLPWRLKSDLRFFKRTTLGNVVIMGRKTFESVGGCLKGRQNIVLSHRAQLFDAHVGCQHSHSVAEALYLREKFAQKEAFIIGGALTYAEFSPFVDRYLVTIVRSRFPNADAFFDNNLIGALDDWERRELDVERVEATDADEFDFSIIELRHKSPDRLAEARRKAISDFEKRNHILVRKQLKRHAAVGMTLDQILSLA